MARKAQGKNSYGYVNARYIRHTSKKSGRKVTAGVKKVIYYNAYGNKEINPEMRLRGPIYDQEGKPVSYKAYRDWGVGRIAESNYTYRVIVSPKGHLLEDEDFVSSVAGSLNEMPLVNDDFRLVVHRDTDHAHAHVLFQTDKTLSKKELETWKRDLRQQMMSFEEIRAKEKGLSVPVVEDEAPVAESAKKTRKRSRRRRRSRGKDNDLSL